MSKTTTEILDDIFDPSKLLSLRDYFAAAALTGLLSNGRGSWPEQIAESAYRQADAMMEVRRPRDG